MFDSIIKKFTNPLETDNRRKFGPRYHKFGPITPQPSDQRKHSTSDNVLRLNYWNNTNDLVWMPKAPPFQSPRAELIPEVLEWIAENAPGTKVEKSPIWNLGVDITFEDHRDMIAFMLRWL